MPVPSSHCSDFITLTLCNLKSELQYPFLSSISCFYPVVCLFVFVCLFVCLFRDRVSLNGCGCPETHSIDQAGLELRNLSASASQVLGLKACVTGKNKFLTLMLDCRTACSLLPIIPALEDLEPSIGFKKHSYTCSIHREKHTWIKIKYIFKICI